MPWAHKPVYHFTVICKLAQPCCSTYLRADRLKYNYCEMICLEISVFFQCTQNYIDLIGNIYIQSRTASDFLLLLLFYLIKAD